MAADRVDFVDEDDAGGVFLTLLEQVANTAGADTDEHLHEVGTRDGEERNVRFAGDGASEQGLSSSWRPDKQNALGDATTELLEFLGIFQEVDNFVELFLGFVDPGDIFEGGLLLLRGEQTRTRFTETE